ncbi:hypothetical protein FJTKL_08832 [Diaporthe vaccinii]|uniref:Uncharacterized protein n=1 Tax=Diaporthe vaccinii TaxID=105482 RepID=A0ABR4EPP6_9PEZI
MFVAALIQALLLTKALVLSKPVGTDQHDEEVAGVADNMLARQLLLLDEDSRIDEDIDLIRLKNGMQAHVSPAAPDEDETNNWGNQAFPSGPRNELGPRIFVSVPTEPEGDDGESDSVI